MKSSQSAYDLGTFVGVANLKDDSEIMKQEISLYKLRLLVTDIL